MLGSSASALSHPDSLTSKEPDNQCPICNTLKKTRRVKLKRHVQLAADYPSCDELLDHLDLSLSEIKRSANMNFGVAH